MCAWTYKQSDHTVEGVLAGEVDGGLAGVVSIERAQLTLLDQHACDARVPFVRLAGGLRGLVYREVPLVGAVLRGLLPSLLHLIDRRRDVVQRGVPEMVARVAVGAQFDQHLDALGEAGVSSEEHRRAAGAVGGVHVGAFFHQQQPADAGLRNVSMVAHC